MTATFTQATLDRLEVSAGRLPTGGIVLALLLKLVSGELRVVLWEEKGCIITHRRYENGKLGEVLRSRTRS